MCSRISASDDLCEFAIQFLLSQEGSGRQLAVALARKDPDLAPLELMLVMSMAVSSIEEMLGGQNTDAIVLDGWRATALIGVELRMMQRRGVPCGRCADLLRYWQTRDGFFLT